MRIALIAFLACCGVAMAAPERLVFDKNVRNRTNASPIKKVHLEIPTNTTDRVKIRYAIIQGMIRTKGRTWTFEGEGDSYILARFDYRGHTIIMRIEYDGELIQLKYHGGSEAYECKNLVADGICYKNHKNYYGYTGNLRTSILRQALSWQEGAE